MGSRAGPLEFRLSWLESALQATSLPFGVISALGYRYHPAAMAQAAATLARTGRPKRRALVRGYSRTHGGFEPALVDIADYDLLSSKNRKHPLLRQ